MEGLGDTFVPCTPLGMATFELLASWRRFAKIGFQ